MELHPSKKKLGKNHIVEISVSQGSNRWKVPTFEVAESSLHETITTGFYELKLYTDYRRSIDSKPFLGFNKSFEIQIFVDSVLKLDTSENIFSEIKDKVKVNASDESWRKAEICLLVMAFKKYPEEERDYYEIGRAHV